jgi:hypothetical protein
MAIDARCRTFLCRASPMRGMATSTNADRLQTSRAVAHLCRLRVHRSPTTIDTPMEAQMRTPTHRLSSDRRPRT